MESMIRTASDRARAFFGVVTESRETQLKAQEVGQREHAMAALRQERADRDSKAVYVAPPQPTKARKESIKAQIISLIKRHGDRGIIAEDACRALSGTRYSSVTARFSELEREGIIKAAGQRPTVYSGSMAVVWKLAEAN